MKLFDGVPCTFKVPPGLLAIVDGVAGRQGLRRSDVIRQALANYLASAGERLPPRMDLVMRGGS